MVNFMGQPGWTPVTKWVVKHPYRHCWKGVFKMRLAFTSTDFWEKQVTLCNVGGPYLISWRPPEQKLGFPKEEGVLLPSRNRSREIIPKVPASELKIYLGLQTAGLSCWFWSWQTPFSTITWTNPLKSLSLLWFGFSREPSFIQNSLSMCSFVSFMSGFFFSM